MVEELKRDLITTLKHAANIRGVQPDEWVILTVVGGRQMAGMFGGGMMRDMSVSTGTSFAGVSSGGMGAGFGGYGAYGGAGGGMGGMMGGVGAMGGHGSSSGHAVMGGGMMGGMGGGMGGYGVMGPSSSTVLTIRAKKSDVDAFAGGELDLDRFQEKVKTLMY